MVFEWLNREKKKEKSLGVYQAKGQWSQTLRSQRTALSYLKGYARH